MARPTIHGRGDDTDRERTTLAVGGVLMALAAVLGWALLTLWPAATVEGGRTVWLNFTELRALLIAIACGALGAFVHAATSFASFAGNRALKPSWVWWFLLRPAIGASLALLLYFTVRSTLMLEGPLGEAMSPFGVAAISAGAGLFAKQAVDKLKWLSDTAFNSSADGERADKL